MIVFKRFLHSSTKWIRLQENASNFRRDQLKEYYQDKPPDRKQGPLEHEFAKGSAIFFSGNFIYYKLNSMREIHHKLQTTKAKYEKENR